MEIKEWLGMYYSAEIANFVWKKLRERRVPAVRIKGYGVMIMPSEMAESIWNLL